MSRHAADLNLIPAQPGSAPISRIGRYGQVSYAGLLPGIDLHYYGRSGQIEYDVVIAPGADPAKFRWESNGPAPTLDQDGSLTWGNLRWHAPVGYQSGPDGRIPVDVSFQIGKDQTVGFRVGAYDHKRTLVIDPVVTWTREILPDALPNLTAPNLVASDSDGNAFVAGVTNEVPSDAIQVPGKVQTGSRNLFVAKWRADGSLAFFTLLGCEGFCQTKSLRVDSQGNPYLFGSTSGSVPVTTGVVQPNRAGPFGEQAFLLKLRSTGDALSYSTYLGASLQALITSFLVNPDGTVWIGGSEAGYEGIGFVQLLAADASKILRELKVGGPGTLVSGLASEGDGDLYVSGSSQRNNFPGYITPFFVPETGGPAIFVTKLRPATAETLYTIKIGGSSNMQVKDLAVRDGQAYVLLDAYYNGDASIQQYPGRFIGLAATTEGIYSVLTKINREGNSFLYSRYLTRGESRNIAVGTDHQPWAAVQETSGLTLLQLAEDGNSFQQAFTMGMANGPSISLGLQEQPLALTGRGELFVLAPTTLPSGYASPIRLLTKLPTAQPTTALVVSLEPETLTLLPGKSVSVTARITNRGTIPAEDVFLQAPVSFRYGSFPDTGLNRRVGTIAPGETVVLKGTLLVPDGPSVPSGTVLPFSAFVRSSTSNVRYNNGDAAVKLTYDFGYLEVYSEGIPYAQISIGGVQRYNSVGVPGQSVLVEAPARVDFPAIGGQSAKTYFFERWSDNSRDNRRTYTFTRNSERLNAIYRLVNQVFAVSPSIALAVEPGGTVRFGASVASAVAGTYSTGPLPSWLKLSNPTGALPASLQFTADATGLSPGTYQTVVNVLGEPGTSPATIAITLTVRTSTIAGFPFTLGGPRASRPIQQTSILAILPQRSVVGRYAFTAVTGQVGKVGFETVEISPNGTQASGTISGDTSSNYTAVGPADVTGRQNGFVVLSASIQRWFSTAAIPSVLDQPAAPANGAAIAGGAVFKAGNLDVAILIPGTAIWLYQAQPGTRYADPVKVAIPSGTRDWVLSDLDGDGLIDFLLLQTDGSVALLQNAGGQLKPPQAIQSGPVSEVRAQDVNGDGRIDLIALSADRTAVRILLSIGAGLYSAPISTPLAGKAIAFTAGDANGDGRADLLVSLGETGFWQLRYADASFQFPTVKSLELSGASSAEIVDFAGDGRPELVASYQGFDNGYIVYPWQEKGTFGLAEIGRPLVPADEDIWSGVLPFNVGGDLNGDGLADSVYLTELIQGSSFSIAVRLALPTGGFGDPSYTHFEIHTDYSSGYARVIDFDGDGKQDVLVYRYDRFYSEVAISFCKGDGHGQLAACVKVASTPGDVRSQILTRDLNGDGRPDFLMLGLPVAFTPGQSEVRLFLNNGRGSVVESATLASDNSYLKILNNRAAPGPGLLRAEPNGLSVLPVLADGTFGPPIVSSLDPARVESIRTARNIRLFDANSDGRADIVVESGSSTATTIATFVNNGDNTFRDGAVLVLDSLAGVAGVGDFDGDGLADLAISMSGQTSGEPVTLRVIAFARGLSRYEVSAPSILLLPTGNPGVTGELGRRPTAFTLKEPTDPLNLSSGGSLQFSFGPSSPNPSGYWPTGRIHLKIGDQIVATKYPESGVVDQFISYPVSSAQGAASLVYEGDENYQGERFLLPENNILTFTPRALDITAGFGREATATLRMSVFRRTWSLSFILDPNYTGSAQPAISLDAGSCQDGTSCDVQVRLLRTGLSVGTYSGNIVVQSQGGATIGKVPLTIRVQTVAGTLVPGSYEFSAAGGTGSFIYTSSDGETPVQFFPFCLDSPPGACTPSWLTITGVTRRDNAATVTFSAAPNLTAQARSAYIQTGLGQFRVTQAGVRVLQVSQAELRFQVTRGGLTPLPQSIDVSSSRVGVSVAVQITGGAPWLTISPGRVSTPGSFSLQVNPSGLAPGTYTTQLLVSEAPANGDPIPVRVTLTVQAPSLLLKSGRLEFQRTSGTVAIAPQQITLGNSGSGTLRWQLGTLTGAWLKVDSTEGTAPGSLTVRADAAGLAPGDYQGSITLLTSDSSTPLVIPATLHVPVLSLEAESAATESVQTALASGILPLTANGGPVSAAVLVNGGSWSADVASWDGISGGSWLQISPAFGGNGEALTITADPKGLAPGTYRLRVLLRLRDSSDTLSLGVSLIVK